MLRALWLSVLLAGCVTNRGHVSVPATVAATGGMFVIGGVGVAFDRCEPSSEQCDRVEKGDPEVATGMVVVGAALLALGAVLYNVEDKD